MSDADYYNMEARDEGVDEVKGWRLGAGGGTMNDE